MVHQERIREVEKVISQVLNKKLPVRWKEFTNNIGSNVNLGVFYTVQFMLMKSIPMGDWPGKYFSPVKGFNVGNNPFGSSYSEDQFQGYFGCGHFKGELLNTAFVARLLGNTNYPDILRIDLKMGIDNAKIELIGPKENNKFNYDTGSMLYYARIMQYDKIRVPKSGEIAICSSYNKNLRNILHRFSATSVSKITDEELANVGAVEFVIPDIQISEAGRHAFLPKVLANNIFQSLYPSAAGK